MSFFHSIPRSVARAGRTSTSVYAVVFIVCGILMFVTQSLVMPYNVTREAIIKDKICQLSYEKAEAMGIDMKRENADLDKLLDVVLEIDLIGEQEELLKKGSGPRAKTRELGEIFDIILERLYEDATAAGFKISIEDVSTEKNRDEVRRTIINSLREKMRLNIWLDKYEIIDVKRAVLEAVYEKARGIIDDKVWEDARKTVIKDINSAQVVGILTDNVKQVLLDRKVGKEIRLYLNVEEKFASYDKTWNELSLYINIVMISGVLLQIAAVIISVLGAARSRVCIYISMAIHGLGILLYIFFPLAGMNFSGFDINFSFLTALGFTAITVSGEITKYLLLDLLLKIIALIALFRFKRLKYDVYGAE